MTAISTTMSVTTALCSVCSEPAAVTYHGPRGRDQAFCSECFIGLKAFPSIKKTTSSKNSDDNSKCTKMSFTACVTCGDRQPKQETVECIGKSRHSFCIECFNNYVSNAVKVGGSYCAIQSKNEDANQQSGVGELPCPFFKSDECTCHSFPVSRFRRILTDAVDERWRRAIARNAVTLYQQEAQATMRVQRNLSRNDTTNLEHLRRAVTEALSLGSRMVCPSCNQRGIKDDECIHIYCESCSKDWCYCCNQDDCETCDSYSSCLEENPGYENKNIGDETEGYGALHEFHRKKIAFFLRQLKDKVPATLWNQLQERNQSLLNDVPTEGRCIDWDNIDSAELPLIGETCQEQVLWQDDMGPVIKDLLQNLDFHNEHDNQSNQEETEDNDNATQEAAEVTAVAPEPKIMHKTEETDNGIGKETAPSDPNSVQNCVTCACHPPPSSPSTS